MISKQLKIHFETLGLITVARAKTINSGLAMFWNLTEVGKELMIKLRNVKKQKHPTLHIWV